uniref:Uncharacterized protein n=1 Tax=Rhizophora mucronata TaxID=61149 RepID=A0A2P2PYW4_RHIMU
MYADYPGENSSLSTLKSASSQIKNYEGGGA